MLTDQIQRLRTVRLLKVVEEEVLTLERAKDRYVQSFLDWTSQTKQQRIRKTDDVRRRFVLHPVDKLVDLFALKTIFTFQHGNRHLAERLRIGRERSTRGEIQSRF